MWHPMDSIAHWFPKLFINQKNGKYKQTGLPWLLGLLVNMCSRSWVAAAHIARL